MSPRRRDVRPPAERVGRGKKTPPTPNELIDGVLAVVNATLRVNLVPIGIPENQVNGVATGISALVRSEIQDALRGGP